MHKLFFLSLFVVTMLSGNAQKVSQPNKVKYYGPVEIQSPILLDSMSLSQEKFSDRTLLESQISFPDISRFSTELTPDSSGFFHLTKPQRNHYFHLISFFVSADGYGAIARYMTSSITSVSGSLRLGRCSFSSSATPRNAARQKAP